MASCRHRTGSGPDETHTSGKHIMSDDVIRLAKNLIGPADNRRLESYGAHVIQNGAATRFAWGEQDGTPHFDIFKGGADEVLAARIGRHRDRHEFHAEDRAGQEIATGTLDHVMAELDRFLQVRPGDPGTPA